ncbi:MAG: hypothetical protein M3362_10975 [Acidobacteriota bacterium]|nr:hypothetical protein [Acidobacteriota bacterium]
MEINLLQKNFGRMGARVLVGTVENRFRQREGINIRNDEHGEFFDILLPQGATVSYEVVDIDVRLRHLLLLSRNGGVKTKFLCGHDERHWFVCAVPDTSATNVRKAMESLQPAEVRVAVNRKVKRAKNRLSRRNEAFVRQGEWFFIPAPNLVVKETEVHKNEPISRGGGSKPHMCQQLYRSGGEVVWVSSKRPNGVTKSQYEQLLKSNRKAKNWDWRMMRRNAAVYVRGRVWHKDHKTIVLKTWHRVLMNTENQAPGRGSVVFLD